MDNGKELSSSVKFLIELMDDDNDQSASMAMAELLRNDSDVSDALHEMDKSDSPRLRKRTRQIRHAMSARSRRHIFDCPPDAPVSLLEGLTRLHLCWFDNDRQVLVDKQWNELEARFNKASPRNFSELSSFLQKEYPFKEANREFRPESFCLGVVLDDKTGSDLIFCCIALVLSQKISLKLHIIRTGMETGLIEDRSGLVMFPNDNWLLYDGVDGQQKVEYWDTREILRYTASVLFVSAIASDGFRYLYTIGAQLAAAVGEKSLAFLPFPYGDNDVSKGEVKP